MEPKLGITTAMKDITNKTIWKPRKRPICESCEKPYIRTRGEDQKDCLFCLNPRLKQAPVSLPT